jgi:hypothetical protein
LGFTKKVMENNEVFREYKKGAATSKAGLLAKIPGLAACKKQVKQARH